MENIFLTIAIILSIGFAHLFKIAQNMGCKQIVVITVNYFVAAILLICFHFYKGIPEISSKMLSVGITTGIIFTLTLKITTYSLNHLPVNLVMMVFRLSIFVPVIFALFLWNESLTLSQFLGICLCFISIFFMSPNSKESTKTISKVLLLISLVILGQGLSQTGLQAIHYMGLDPVFLFVLMIIFISASITGIVIILITKQNITKIDLSMGTFIGAYNLIGLAVTLKTMTMISPALFWPLNGCVTVVIDAIISHYIWKDYLTIKKIIGVAISIPSILLILL